MKNSSYFLIEYKNDAQFECQIDKIVTSVKVYLMYFILFKGRVQQYQLCTQIFNTFLDQFLLIFMRCEITIDTQLNFDLIPVKNFLSTTLVHQKVHLVPFIKVASRVKR